MTAGAREEARAAPRRHGVIVEVPLREAAAKRREVARTARTGRIDAVRP